MAHNLNENNGKYSMMYVGGKPWHGLGQYLGETAIDANTAIEAAQMNWKVSTTPLYFKNSEGEVTEIKDRKAIIREDTQDILGLKSDHYRPLQNSDAFKVLDLVVGENAAVWHTAGVIGKGERIWVSAKIPGSFSIGSKDDRIEQYFLLTNGHDGLSSIQIKFTPVRVVCQNTLKQALIADENRVMNIKHMGLNMENRVKQSAELLSRLYGYAKIFADDAERMYSYKMNDNNIDDYMKELLKIEDDEMFVGAKAKKYNTIMDLVESGRGTEIEGVRGSLWGVYNAITEYVDHNANKQGNEKWILTGGGFKLKENAWDMAMKLVK